MNKRLSVHPVAIGFALLGLYLLWSARHFPSAPAGLPGPGFFPEVAGAAMLGFSAALALGRPGEAVQWTAGRAARIRLVAVILLMLGHLSLWGIVPFSIRTLVLISGVLRLGGVRWKDAIVAGTLITVAVTVGFTYGLHVRFS